MKLFTTKATIVTAIESIRTKGAALDQMIQVAACSVINHIEEHGDITLLNTLIEAMPKGSRVNALRDFLNTFGKVSYDEATKAFAYDKKAKTDLVGAQGIMWTEFKPEQPYVPFDLKALINGLIKKADTAAKDDKHKEEIDFELLAGLRTMMEPDASELAAV